MNDIEREELIKNYNEIINLYKKAFAITGLQKDKEEIERCEAMVEQLKRMV